MKNPSRSKPRTVDLAKPPEHLSPESRELWRRLLDDYHLDDAAGLALVRAACEAFDRAEGARRLIAAEGATLRDRFSQLKAHPAVAVERDARGQLIAAVRAMRLQPGDVGAGDD
ncbi:hypothetical protein MOJ79_07125 [Calidifontimicrobium sp. SYSU G02091]|uniref:P27 family phage terminase small subunit n=1 Tax=Calidifontimicrobium sp. SYSU G02091 TaxID=2926421 RepID=UPI001F53DA0C|nr:P27 family phage terminase small subunit [Calidifontimicrobium sp. SYSU G02091]MCI1191609.1 hypothetical protein [Calidifontimicrobium sp. SYSU G02091]